MKKLTCNSCGRIQAIAAAFSATGHSHKHGVIMYNGRELVGAVHTSFTVADTVGGDVVQGQDPAAATTTQNKINNAIGSVQAEVARIKAIAPGSRTSSEKGFLGIAYLQLSEE